jgi:hypothetical protein
MKIDKLKLGQLLNWIRYDSEVEFDNESVKITRKAKDGSILEFRLKEDNMVIIYDKPMNESHVSNHCFYNFSEACVYFNELCAIHDSI